ncbi:unnamed protein product [Parajaminaea phylloscopi]
MSSHLDPGVASSADAGYGNSSYNSAYSAFASGSGSVGSSNRTGPYPHQYPSRQPSASNNVADVAQSLESMSIRAPSPASAAFQHKQMYPAAGEVKEENSLAAIADQVDQAASDLRQGESGARTPAPPSVDQSWSWQHDHQHQQHLSYGPSVDRGMGPNGGSSGAGGEGSGWYPQHGSYQYGGGYAPAWGSQDGHPYYQQQQQQQQHPQQHPHQYQHPHPHQHSYQHPQHSLPPQTQHGYEGYYDPGAYASANANANASVYSADSNPNAYYGLEYPPTASQHAVSQPPLPPPGTLYRQGTTLSMGSNHSGSLNPRRRSKDAGLPQQSLPFNKNFVNEYRARMKADPDPEEQFRFARYLIEAAKKIHDPSDGPKQARKYRDSLLSESLKLIKRLATTGMGLGKPPYAEAQFFLANCFGNGSLGLQVDHEKAYNLYVQASKQNHPAATYRTAVCNEVGAGTRRDHHRAVLFYRKASALGDTAGMYKLGMILLNGLLGQQRNVREAIVWLKRAAGQADEDNPHALHELGLLHEKPNSVVPHDEPYSRELFTQAAQLGYAPSQFKLGSAYEYGALTCPVDPRRSIAWYTKAAGKNDGESELALSGWYLTGSEGVLKQSDAEAYLWARRAATKGIPKAEYAVGYYSEVGIGVKADLEEAKKWYMRAAAQGNKRAMQRLTELKKMGAKAGKARPTRGDAEKECVVM